MRIFISYTHDSRVHRSRVLGFAKRLSSSGFDSRIDQFLSVPPPEGWPLWMEREIELADAVIVVCTEIYHRRYRGNEEPGVGKGAVWEAVLTRQDLYESCGRNLKYIPVIFDRNSHSHIPKPLRATTYYHLPDDTERLVRRLKYQEDNPLNDQFRPFPGKGAFNQGDESKSLRWGTGIGYLVFIQRLLSFRRGAVVATGSPGRIRDTLIRDSLDEVCRVDPSIVLVRCDMRETTSLVHLLSMLETRIDEASRRLSRWPKISWPLRRLALRQKDSDSMFQSGFELKGPDERIQGLAEKLERFASERPERRLLVLIDNALDAESGQQQNSGSTPRATSRHEFLREMRPMIGEISNRALLVMIGGDDLANEILAETTARHPLIATIFSDHIALRAGAELENFRSSRNGYSDSRGRVHNQR